MALGKAAAALVVTAWLLAACGGSASGGSSGAASAQSTRPTAIYRVSLSGQTNAMSGATQGRGAAIIAFHGDSRLCWRFAHLHGFTDAMSAQLHAEATGETGRLVMPLSTGPRLHHQGCTSVDPTLSKAVISDPSGLSVTIPSTRYPGGAVRAQL
jgi:hypothetical protein